MFRTDATPPARAGKSSKASGGGKSAAAAAGELGPGDQKVFDQLKAWRKQAAAGKPPYIVFNDATLREIATIRPDTLDKLAEINGVGAAKLDKYGEQVLEVLAADS
jgi:ATP-dependent DNA helicase RecQ